MLITKKSGEPTIINITSSQQQTRQLPIQALRSQKKRLIVPAHLLPLQPVGLKRYQEYIELIYTTEDPRKMTPFAIPMLIVNAGNNLITMMTGAKGPSAVQVSACATGADNIGHAFDLIRAGRIDRALAGCSDYPITNLGVAVFDKMRAYSRTNDIDKAMKPFDRDRTGFVFGEGCGVVAIETLESAKNGMCRFMPNSLAMAQQPMPIIESHQFRMAQGQPMPCD